MGVGDPGGGLAHDARLQALAGDTPAVIVARLDDVDLVAAGGAVLGLPEQAGGGIESQAFGIAVAIGPDRAQRARRGHEGIVLGDGAVIVETMDLAQRRSQVLRHLEIVALAHRPEEMPLAVEQEARAVMVGAGAVGIFRRLEQHLLLDPFIGGIDLTAHDPGHGGGREIGRLVLARLHLIARRHGGIGEINPAVLRVIGMQRDIQHAAVLAHEHGGRALHGLGQLAGLVQEADAPGALGEDHAAVRQEGEAPGLVQPFGQRLHLEGGLLGLHHLAGDVRDSAQLAIEVARHDAQIGRHLRDFIRRQQSLEAVIGERTIADRLHDLRIAVAAQIGLGQEALGLGAGLQGLAMTARAGGGVDFESAGLAQRRHRHRHAMGGQLDVGGRQRRRRRRGKGLRQCDAA